jgi:hypothetical protein
MRLLFPLVLAALSLGPQARAQSVAAVVESTLATGAGQVRQFAFDGDPDTYFASEKPATRADHITLTFDAPVTVTSVTVTTGRPAGGDTLTEGVLEGSADGKTFDRLAAFVQGTAAASPGKRLLALRIRPSSDLPHALVIREIALASDPVVATFKYPVEIQAESEAPEMKAWVEKAARICERQYPMICEALKSDGFKPRTTISMTLRNNYNGVAATSGGRITGSVRYFTTHRDDFGAMVHETVHVVQSYRGRGNPGWLVEGVADYIRFYRFETDKQRPPTPERARYDGSYRVTARFLNYVSEKYDKELVRKLNAAMRRGEYAPEIWQRLTKKTVQQLGDEWKESLR